MTLEGSTQELIRTLEEQGSRLSPQAAENLKTWLGDREYAPFVPEIAALIGAARWEDLEDSFYAHLNIGTGGIRGPLGVGPNRVNLRTIGEAAQGLCHFIEDYGPEAKQAGVVVGHEARRGSKDFAVLCCEVFAANGIRSFLFDSLRATPEISFAVRYLKATAGVQITASHNPRTDNGFKFYWSDGAQVLPPHDTKFMQLVSEVRQIRRMPLSEAQGKGLVSGIGREVDEPYFQAIRGLSTNPSRSADIVFSPIHGAGATNVLPVLQAENFKVARVLEQIEPDENFPTAHGDLINPEFREVMELPIRIAEELGSDVAICSDPDADRVGVAARINWDSPKVEFLTGNQVGVALTEYILTHRNRAGLGSERDLILETFVTTSLISDIASQGFGLTPRNDLLVGFKFIAQIIGEMGNPADFVFGAEESLGYLAGDFVRDKDAAIASLLICEMVSWLKDQGKTLPMYLDDIYRRYGYYKNLQLLVELPGKTGLEIMRTVMLYLRHAPPEEVAGVPVVKVIDRLDEAQRPPAVYRLGGSGDMLSFCLSEDLCSRVTIRPSGTEPKLKCYVQHYSPAGAGDLAGVKAAIDTAAHALGSGLLQYGYRGLPGELQKEWDRSTQKAL